MLDSEGRVRITLTIPAEHADAVLERLACCAQDHLGLGDSRSLAWAWVHDQCVYWRGWTDRRLRQEPAKPAVAPPAAR